VWAERECRTLIRSGTGETCQQSARQNDTIDGDDAATARMITEPATATSERLYVVSWTLGRQTGRRVPAIGSASRAADGAASRRRWPRLVTTTTMMSSSKTGHVRRGDDDGPIIKRRRPARRRDALL